MAFSKPYDPEQSRKNDAQLPYRHYITDIAGLHDEKDQQGSAGHTISRSRWRVVNRPSDISKFRWKDPWVWGDG